MIALRLSVPIACWRKAHAREFLESEVLPPPATCYGALLSLVGEEDRDRHVGCRVTSGMLNEWQASVVLRTLWQIKKKQEAQGTGPNIGPDFHQLVIGSDLVVWVDSSAEPDPATGLEARVLAALSTPATVERFGGWSLGESTHLINDVWLLDGAIPPGPCRTFLVGDGDLSLPVWVDHVGFAGTRYAVGRIEVISARPPTVALPQILSA
jgi:CRISPR-associated protein Cas5t